MDDLSNYFSQQNKIKELEREVKCRKSELDRLHKQEIEINRLNKQINMISNFYRKFYEGKIKRLTTSLQTSYARTVKYKYLAGMSEPAKNKELAIELLIKKKLGSINKSLGDIAKECGYSYSRIRSISSELNNK